MISLSRTEILAEFPDMLSHHTGFELVFDDQENLISALWRDPVYKDFDGRLEMKHFEKGRLLITENGGQFVISNYNESTQIETSNATDKDDGSTYKVEKKMTKKDWIRSCLENVRCFRDWDIQKSDEQRIEFYNLLAEAVGYPKPITVSSFIKTLLQFTLLSPFMLYAVIKEKFFKK